MLDETPDGQAILPVVLLMEFSCLVLLEPERLKVLADPLGHHVVDLFEGRAVISSSACRLSAGWSLEANFY